MIPRQQSRWSLISLACSFLFLAPLTAVAQSNASQPPEAPIAQTPVTQSPNPESQEPAFTIRQNVRRVIVDVTVRDSSGKPVHGLTASDFSITEDKQPQRVQSFDVYDFDKASISRGPNAPPLPTNVFENIPVVPERGPLYVILIDMVNIATEDEMSARQQVLKFIAKKPSGTRFAIFITTDKLRLVQGFTDDKDLLTATLDGKHPHPHVPRAFIYGGNSGRGNVGATIDMLTHIGEYLDGIPGRKNLLWVGGPFPVQLFAGDGQASDLQDAVIAETNALAQAQVAIYPVDVRGVQLDISTPFTSGFAEEDMIAARTGGRAFYSANDVADTLAEATEDGGNYYTLTYSPSSTEDDGKCHKIKVSLDRQNLDRENLDRENPAGQTSGKQHYQLSYRQQYCRAPLVSTVEDASMPNGKNNVGGPPTIAVPLQAGDLLQGNIRPGAPMLHDLVFSAHMRAERATLATPTQMQLLETQAAFYRTQTRNHPLKPIAPVKIQTITVDYRVLDPQSQNAANGKPRTLEFAVAAFDDDGKVLNGIVNDGVQDVSTPSETKSGLFRMRQTLVVPVSAKSIRVGVRDRMNDRMGTLETPLPLAPETVAKK